MIPAIPSPSTRPLRERGAAGARRVKTALTLGTQAGGGRRSSARLARGEGAGMRGHLGLSPDDFDFNEGWLDIRRQVKRVRSRLVLGLPKNDHERRTPLPDWVSRNAKEYFATY